MSRRPTGVKKNLTILGFVNNIVLNADNEDHVKTMIVNSERRRALVKTVFRKISLLLKNKNILQYLETKS